MRSVPSAPAPAPVPPAAAAAAAQRRPPTTPSPVPFLRRFASTYINWSWQTVAPQMARLALQSSGQARSELAMAAAQSDGDAELRQAEISNQGQVEAVAPLTERPGTYVVVTRETTTAGDSAAYQGLTPEWHLTLATLVHRGGRWIVSLWQPEN